MDYQEILKEVQNFYQDDVDSFAFDEDNTISEEVGPFKEVEQYGGEGQGDTWYSVKYFKDHDVYIRVDGWYQSHMGTEFNGWKSCSEVRPKQKTITVFE